jgi:ribulose-5-phosphate 4-epimerase/fuculose-1-phosphate aldolase
VVGSGGNLSARRPGDDEIWVTARGTWLDRLTRRDFARVSISTAEVRDAPSGTSAEPVVPTSELALHLATYQARPDVTAIIHLHPQGVLLLDALDVPVRLVTTDHLFYLRRVARTPFAPPGSARVAQLAAQASADGTNCVVLAHHGCSVLADSVELAHKRALYLEEAAQLSYRALALGALDRLPDCPALPTTV